MSALPQPPWNHEAGSPRQPRRGLRRPWGRIGGIFLIVVLLAALAGNALWHSRRVHGWVLRKARERASAAAGVPVALGDFQLSFQGISPTLTAEGVVIGNPAGFAAAAPLLSAPRLAVAVRVDSLWRRQWHLTLVEADSPVLSLVCTVEGRCNLPSPSPSGNVSGSESILDLGIRQIVVKNGRLLYNGRQQQLSADLRGLQLKAAYSLGGNEYSGQLTYSNGWIRYGGYAPLRHALSVRFSATPRGVTLESVALASAPADIHLSGTVTNSSQPSAQLRYQITLRGGQVRRLAGDARIPDGDLRLAGQLAYSGNTAAPLAGLALNGTFDSAGLREGVPGTAPITVGDLHGSYQLANGNLVVTELSANAMGGRIEADFALGDVAGAQRAKVRAHLSGLQWASLSALAPGGSLPVRLTGTISGQATAAWKGAFDELAADADLTLGGEVAPEAGNGEVAVQGSVHGRYNETSQTLTLSDTVLRTAQTQLSANGTLGRQSALAVTVQSGDLRELESMARVFAPVPPLGLAGSGAVQAAIGGSPQAPRMSGTVTAANLKLRGSVWRSLTAQFSAGAAQVQLSGLRLAAAPRGMVSGSASLALRDWHPAPDAPVTADINLTQLDMAELARVAGWTEPVSGALGGDIRVQGSFDDPAGQASLTLAHAGIAGEEVTQATLTASGNGSQVRGTLLVQLPAGQAEGSFAYTPRSEAYEVRLSAPELQLQKLAHVAARAPALRGEVQVTASGSGILDDPQLQAIVRARQLRVQTQVLQELTLGVEVAHHQAMLTLGSRAVETEIQGRATIGLGGDYPATATLSTGPIGIGPLVAAFAPAAAAGLGGRTSVQATAQGPLRHPAQLEAHIVAPSLALSYSVAPGQSLQLAATGPIHADYARGALTLQPAEVRGSGTDLRVAGTVPLAGDGALALHADATVDLRLLEMLEAGAKAGGELTVQIDAGGTLARPTAQGEVRLANLSYLSPTLPLGLVNGNGVLAVSGDHIEVRQFNATLGGGQLTAHGGVAFLPAPTFDLGASADRVRLMAPSGVRETLNGTLALTGTPENALVQGRIVVNQMSLAPGFDITNVSTQLGNGVASPGSWLENLHLNVAVQTNGEMKLISPTFSLSTDANLRISGTADEPIVLGRLSADDGDLLFMGNRYAIQSATLAFTNPAEIEPVVNITASTTVSEYNIQVGLHGPADHLRTEYTSDPALPPADIINLLAFGSTSESSAANPSPGNTGAESLVASQVSNQLTSRVQKIAGISQLSVDPELGSTTGQGPRVTVQQRVSGNLFVTFSADVAGTEREVVEVQYQVSPRMAVTAVRDENGGFALDTRFHKTWH